MKISSGENAGRQLVAGDVALNGNEAQKICVNIVAC